MLKNTLTRIVLLTGVCSAGVAAWSLAPRQNNTSGGRVLNADGVTISESASVKQLPIEEERPPELLRPEPERRPRPQEATTSFAVPQHAAETTALATFSPVRWSSFGGAPGQGGNLPRESHAPITAILPAAGASGLTGVSKPAPASNVAHAPALAAAATNTPNQAIAPAVAPANTTAQVQPATPSLPLVFNDQALQAVSLTGDQAAQVQQLQEDFVQQIGPQNTFDPSYLARWQQAQASSNDILRAKFGWQLFNAMLASSAGGSAGP